MGRKLISSYDEQEMEAGDGGEEEGLNDGEVEENMIVVCPLPYLAHG